jgi:sialic acid synthase SpsE/quercetin dioxygenase-like cupin family protein
MFFDKPLMVLELANNHMGDWNHGISIIKELNKVTNKYKNFNFAIKTQYRNLDNLIHPSYRKDYSYKYIKRFDETVLTEKHLLQLTMEIENNGFIKICSPFDEYSVDLAVQHNYDILKIASCNCQDWPLIEKIASTDKPIIISTAGATLEEINKVILFLTHREKDFCLCHCIGEYPTKDSNLNLGQIDVFKREYPNIKIGFSTHENPDNYDSIKIAIAKGATVFERHIGLKTEKYDLNAYSSTPEQIDKWLESAESAYTMIGECDKRIETSEKEQKDLIGLMRGVYAKKDIKEGEYVTPENVFYAMPNFDNQLLTKNLSKYNKIKCTVPIKKDEPILYNTIDCINMKKDVENIIRDVNSIIINSNVFLPNQVNFELSHHYGIDNFRKIGATIVNCINNKEYCKKIIIVLPNQSHPEHYHNIKHESFMILYGTIIMNLNGTDIECYPGDILTVERGVKHSFRSNEGCIFEEVSTTHVIGDSYYTDNNILKNTDRKTTLTYWKAWLHEKI